DHHEIEYTTKTLSDGRTAFLLDHCPFDSNHTGKDVAIFQDEDGKLGANCFHNSCAEMGWQQFKEAIGPPLPEHYAPPRRGKQQRQAPEVEVTQADHDLIGKLDGLLAEKGAAALFQDAAVLQALARLHVAAPDLSGAARAILRKKRVSMHDLDQALQPHVEELQGPAGHAAGAGDAGHYLLA